MMRPAGPLPGTNCSSMPRSHARRRTAGDAIGFSPDLRAALAATGAAERTVAATVDGTANGAGAVATVAGAGMLGVTTTGALAAAAAAPDFWLPAPSTSM